MARSERVPADKVWGRTVRPERLSRTSPEERPNPPELDAEGNVIQGVRHGTLNTGEVLARGGRTPAEIDTPRPRDADTGRELAEDELPVTVTDARGNLVSVAARDADAVRAGSYEELLERREASRLRRLLGTNE